MQAGGSPKEAEVFYFLVRLFKNCSYTLAVFFFLFVVVVVSAIGRKTALCRVALCCCVEMIVFCISVCMGDSGVRLTQSIAEVWEGAHLLKQQAAKSGLDCGLEINLVLSRLAAAEIRLPVQAKHALLCARWQVIKQ